MSALRLFRSGLLPAGSESAVLHRVGASLIEKVTMPGVARGKLTDAACDLGACRRRIWAIPATHPSSSISALPVYVSPLTF